MKAPAICRELERRGAALSLDGALLLVKPSRVLDDALRAAIRAEKLAIIGFLRKREYSQPTPDEKAAALAKLSREVAAARVGAWCNPTPRVLAAWRDAETATGCALTLSGTPRRKYSNEESAGALYDATLATAEAHRAFDAEEVTAAQRDALLWYARADTASAPLRLL
jgi:hypothetical protein